MITYSLLDSGIFYVNFADTVSLKDIENYLYEFEKLDYLTPDFLSLYDLRGANLELDSEDIQSISKLTEKVTADFRSVKTAFLVDKPKLTAYSFLFSVDHDLEKTTRQVFSNENTALDWLQNK